MNNWRTWYRETFFVFGVVALFLSFLDCIFDVFKSLSGELLIIFAFLGLYVMFIHNKWVLTRSKKVYYALLSVYLFAVFFALSVITHLIKGRNIDFAKITTGSLVITALIIIGLLLYELYYYLKLKRINKRLEKYRDEK